MDANQDGIVLSYLMKTVKMKQDDSHLSVFEMPSYFTRDAGILKYLRESDCELTVDTQTEAPSYYLIKCEYCGQEVSPSLDKADKAEFVFCCDQWKQLYRLLLNLRNVREGKSEELTITQDHSENKDLMYQRSKAKFSSFLVEPRDDKSKARLFEDYLTEMPVLDNVAPDSNVMNFRLSCPVEGSWARLPKHQSERRTHFLDANRNYEFSVSICAHKPLDFGLCHYQDGGDFVSKYYADGLKFLLVLEDGSAQVYYPSGLLAILVTVTKAHGRVCIVYDDNPGQSVRALFQSDGKGACYHNNGNIWLIINKYGCERLDPDGTRVSRWTWYKLGSTPLRPIFLCINKIIRVRVLGKQQVFVSFLANGKQVKFNVGSWCCKGNCKEVLTPPTFGKDELIVLAYKIKTEHLIQKIHQLMCTSTLPVLPNAAPTPHLHRLAHKLLKLAEKVPMSKKDSDFLQSCLKGFL
ncbi:glutamate-rich protein 6 isoform X2 [Boleophthalmus pectinirostris]|uniref:glutamate-rich protein 6 isoform X2 n=1 Tax=Boleophthalmus pectinirostris TaxID=150288 RepID=UPI00242C1DB3|nr:glutamate-rich protein 6 isoform X2 [Boleophthalmus pectinirostris]